MESILVIALFFFLMLWMISRKPAKFPPGPPRWPVLGNIIELRNWGSLPHLAIDKLSKRYGEIAGFYIGNNPVVVISGLVAIHEISEREDLAGRLKSPYKMFHDKGEPYGITGTSGEKWEEHREFALRKLGKGLKGVEKITHREIEAVFQELNNSSDKNKESSSIMVQDILGMAILNVILHVIIGKRYDHSDQTLIKLMYNIKKMQSLSDPCGGLFVILPLNQQQLSAPSKFSRVERLYCWLQYFFQEEFDQHRKTFKSNVTRDFMDSYISEMMFHDSDPESTFTEKQLVSTSFEFLITGTTTTVNTIAFALLYMVLYPEIQIKVQEELDDIVGLDELPTLEDRINLPFTEATLMEVLRKSCVLPLSIPHASHKAYKDIKYREFVIPKNARVILNLHGLHNDTHVWLDPKRFRPERFLDQNGKVAAHDGLLPFGIGKRSCVGEALALNILFLIFSSLMKRYTFKVPDGEGIPSEEPIGNFLLAPKRFSVQMVPRIGTN